MITYLIKSAACMLLLLLVYHALLEREKIHRFNRFFLIFSLIFSLTIPLLTINIGTPTQLTDQIDVINHRLNAQSSATTEFMPKITPEENPTVTKPDSSDIYSPLLIGIYIFVSFVLVVRLLHNLYTLYSTINNNPHTSWQNATLVLVDDGSIPHSFFSYIFVDRNLYQSDKINEVVLTHELTHTRQRHSLDILFIEGLKIVFWFNPVLYFYKRAMQTNHEFLADEAVVADSSNVQSYQKLLLKMQTGSNNLQLASSIQFSITKKRIIMMTKKSTRLRRLYKQGALIPVLAGLIFAFSTRTSTAQNVDQMTLSELMDTVYERMEATDSFSAEEQEKLQNLISKMQRKLPGPPAPPKPQMDHNVSPPPPAQRLEETDSIPKPKPPVKIDTTKLNHISKKYSLLIDRYVKIKPIPANRTEMEATRKKIKKVYSKWKKIEDKKSVVLPPPPQNVSARINAHKDS